MSAGTTLESTSYAAAVKAAFGFVGLSTGPVRAPLLEIPAGERTQLASLVAAAGIETAELAAVSA